MQSKLIYYIELFVFVRSQDLYQLFYVYNFLRHMSMHVSQECFGSPSIIVTLGGLILRVAHCSYVNYSPMNLVGMKGSST